MSMKTLALLPLALPLLLPTGPASNDLEQSLDAMRTEYIRADVEFLADDALLGRDTPSAGLTMAARFIAARLERLGFEGGGSRGYFAPYELENRKVDSEGSTAWIERDGTRTTLTMGRGYAFHPSGLWDGEAEGAVVDCGEGRVEDYQGLDLEGCWAVVSEGKLSWQERESYAREAGALGLIIVPGSGEDPALSRRMVRWTRSLVRGSVSLPESRTDREPEAKEPRFPSVYLGHEATELLRGNKPTEVGQQLGARFKESRRPVGNGTVEVENVCGLWPGADPLLRKEVLIVSAHYDHVGAHDGDIYNGADDNGSGTSALLAIAEGLATHGPLARSVLLIWVSGEEKGLLGSKAWVRDPTLRPGWLAVAAINMDMVGRNAPDSLLITPSKEHSAYNGLVAIAQKHAAAEGFGPLGNCDAYWGRSDHASFHRVLGIPVAFLFADVHEDYHQPTDTAEKIDSDKIRRAARLTLRILADLQGDVLAL